MSGHPFGPAVEHFQRLKDLRDEQMERLQEATRAELLRCTREWGCPASLHFPSCEAVK